jgi:DNA-binding response OmpR family regulator
MPCQSRARILLLEDEVLVNISTTQLLEDVGFEVLPAEQLASAWELVKDQLPDAAVLDVIIHNRETSLELADWLDARRVPIVFLTGYDIPASTGKWRDHPMCGKPCSPEELEGLLVEALASGEPGGR